MNDLENERDEELIKEREEYEKIYFSQIIDEMMESDALDKLISDRLNYIDNNFDFEPSPEYLRLEEIYYAEYEQKFKNDEDLDHMEDYDYPEGPCENIEGIIYSQPPRDNLQEFEEIPYPDFEEEERLLYQSMEYEEERYSDVNEMDEIINNQIENFNPDYYYGEVFIDEDEKYIENLIEGYEEEDISFFDDIIVEAIQEEHYFEKAIDEIIFDHMEEQYREALFDYDEDPYWYDDYDYDYPSEEQISEEDKALLEPFDSFDEIDYPDIGEPKFDPEPLFEPDYEEEMEKDFERYQKHQEKLTDYSPEVIPEPLEDMEDRDIDYKDVEEMRNQELIKKQTEIELKFKNYLKNDSLLDNLIKEKLKNKKFNQ